MLKDIINVGKEVGYTEYAAFAALINRTVLVFEQNNKSGRWAAAPEQTTHRPVLTRADGLRAQAESISIII